MPPQGHQGYEENMYNFWDSKHVLGLWIYVKVENHRLLLKIGTGLNSIVIKIR